MVFMLVPNFLTRVFAVGILLSIKAYTIIEPARYIRI